VGLPVYFLITIERIIRLIKHRGNQFIQFLLLVLVPILGVLSVYVLAFTKFNCSASGGCDMKKTKLLLVYLLLLGIVILSCSFAGRTLPEPNNDKNIVVIGSIAIDLFEYRGMTKTFRSGVKVIISGRHKEGEKVVHKDYWVNTDERGYFFLPNVPEGDYALRGFRFQTVGSDFFLTAINPLRTENDKYVISRAAKIPDGAFVFKFPQTNRMVNLWHNYFIVDRGQDVHPHVKYTLDNLRLVTGEILQEPDVASYFMSRYPQSIWFKN
jgi:hypothetical protein